METSIAGVLACVSAGGVCVGSLHMRVGEGVWLSQCFESASIQIRVRQLGGR